MDFEKELDRIANQYRREGYFVVTHPDKDHLPEFAALFEPDLLAKRGDENVLVEVKRDRADLESDPNVAMQAGITNAQPGWRYDLIVLGETDPFRKLTREAREPSAGEISAMLVQADRLLQEQFFGAACMVAWAALEAAMRHVASEAELDSPRPSSRELLRMLYGNGFLKPEQFKALDQSYRLRTAIAHGFIPSAFDADATVQPVVEATRYLLNGNLDAHAVGT